jgi:predicted P-loop ATPase
LCYRTDSKGNLKVIQSVKNVEVVLAYDERFARKIRYDEFSNQIYLFGSMPWESKSNFRPWGGHDDSELFAVLQSEYGLLNRNDFFDGLNNTAHKNSFHQVRDYLDQLKWDGVSRIERFFIDFLGAADNQYTREVTKLLTAGAVARIYSPGTKFDYVVILQGAQGCGKSTAIRLLAMNDNWTSDSLDSLDSSSAIQILQGSWILELSELKSLGRTSGGIESVKRFLTATSDKCRLPYQRRPEVFPRQCVFIGSTNRTDYIDDQTGARRFLPIKCGENKPLEDLFNSSTAEYIRQLWAEAVNRYKRENPPLTLPRELLAEIEKRQSDIVTDNGWRGQIIAFLEDKTETCSLAIWRRCLGNTGNPRKYESTEINSILDSLPGWEKSKKVIRFDSEIGVQRGYTKIDQTQICNNVTNDKQELPPPDNDGFINLEGDINYNAPFE